MLRDTPFVYIKRGLPLLFWTLFLLGFILKIFTLEGMRNVKMMQPLGENGDWVRISSSVASLEHYLGKWYVE